MKSPERNSARRKRAAGHPPRVLLVIPTANIIHRQILNGILRYAHQHGPWEFHMITGLFEEQGLRRTQEWGCTGAIAFTDTQAHVCAVLAAAVPVVFINPPVALMGAESPLAQHCCAVRDHAAVGRSAADYFLDRQYAHFSYVGDAQNKAWSCERSRGFSERVAEQGFACAVYPVPPPRERRFRPGEQAAARLAQKIAEARGRAGRARPACAADLGDVHGRGDRRAA